MCEFVEEIVDLLSENFIRAQLSALLHVKIVKIFKPALTELFAVSNVFPETHLEYGLTRLVFFWNGVI